MNVKTLARNSKLLHKKVDGDNIRSTVIHDGSDFLIRGGGLMSAVNNSRY